MDRVPLLMGGRSVGELQIQREGLYVCFSAFCHLSEAGLWCVRLVGEEGSLRLGVLEPCGGEYRICRRFSGRTAAPLGQILRGEVCSVNRDEGAWCVAPAPENLFRTEWIRRELRGMSGVMTMRRNRFLLLALPCHTGGVFPLAPLFCLAQICWIDGSSYTVFTFDEHEWPVLPCPDEENGAETGFRTQKKQEIKKIM